MKSLAISCSLTLLAVNLPILKSIAVSLYNTLVFIHNNVWLLILICGNNIIPFICIEKTHCMIVLQIVLESCSQFVQFIQVLLCSRYTMYKLDRNIIHLGI